jgi:pyruvate formate lyase activating enzyme
MMNEFAQTGRIFNIQRFSVYDGPGIRTVVFFSGCNLKCLWCHNPESISNRQTLKFNAEQCIMCGRCFDLCPNHAHELKDGAHILNREKCTVCLNCVRECYAEALTPVYREITLAELEKSILTDIEYFKHSGGGVTFSGGEPMLQADFLRGILKICKARNIHTAVDTAGAFSFESFEKILPYCGLFLYDMKAFGNETHKRLTGVSNALILENLQKLSDIADVWVRVPVIPGANIDERSGIAEFLSGVNIKK